MNADENTTFKPTWLPANTLKRVAIAFLILFGFWMTYPALSLPPAIIDDLAMLNNSDQWFRYMAEGNVEEALRNDFSVTARVFNLGFTLSNAIRYRISGGQPYHWIRLGQLAWVCAAVFLVVSRIPRRSNGAFIAACGAVLLFLSAETPNGFDMQALRVNWFRLFTADSDALVFLSIHMLAVLAIYRGTTSRAALPLLAFVAIIAGILTYSIKMPYAAMVCAPTLVLAVCAWFYRDRKAAFVLLGTVVVVVFSFIWYNIILRHFAPPATAAAYSESFSMTPGHLWTGLKYYADNCWGMLGPLLPALLAALFMLIAYLWKHRRTEKAAIGLLMYLMVFIGVGFAMYIPWNHRLPRYMVAGIMGLTMLTGLCSSFGFGALAKSWRERKIAYLLLPVGIAAAFLPPVILLVAVVLTTVIGMSRWRNYATPIVAGLALTGIGYLAVITPVVRSATNDLYVAREFANWQATLTALKLAAEGKTVCFAGDVADEHIGSMYGHIDRLGIKAKLYPTSDPENCTTSSIILVSRSLTSPEALATVPPELLRKNINLSKDSYPIPIPFWTFRDRLFDGTPGASYTDTWTSEYIWRFYGPEGSV